MGTPTSRIVASDGLRIWLGDAARAHLIRNVWASGSFAVDVRVFLVTRSVVVLFFGVAVSSAAAAPAGTIDRGFGAGGVAVARTPGSAAAASFLVHGRIVIVGGTFSGRQVLIRGFTLRGKPEVGIGSTARIGVGDARGAGVSSAVLDPVSGLIIVVASSVHGSGARNTLLAFDADGRLDRSFGVAGRVMLPGLQYPGRVAVTSDGTILVAAGGDDVNAPGGVVLDRVSTDGQLLSAVTTPADILGSPSVIVALPDGSALVAFSGDGGEGELVRFDAAGAPDPAYGRDGVARLGSSMSVDAAVLQGSGHLIIAGGHLISYSRSGPTPTNPLLLRVTVAGHVERGFGRIGRGVSEFRELTSVALDGDRIIASTLDGRVMSFRASDGSPDLRFGSGAVSPALADRFGQGGALAVDADDALIAGGSTHALTVARVRLGGVGVLAPRTGRRVTVSRIAGPVSVRVPISRVSQPLRAPVSAPLEAGRVSLGEDGIYTPPATTVAAFDALARIDGVGGRAVVRDADVTLRRTRGAVAALNVARVACGSPATLTLSGRFVVAVPHLRLLTISRHSRLRVRGCDPQDPIKILKGRVSLPKRS